jgi:hypothetical protein
VSLLTLATNHSMAQTAPTMPIEINPYTKDMAFANLMFYLNSTDNHYHLKGLVKNILPESRDSMSIMINFQDQSTGTSLHTVFYHHGPIDSNAITAFDVDTGYNTTQAYQFRYMKAQIT